MLGFAGPLVGMRVFNLDTLQTLRRNVHMIQMALGTQRHLWKKNSCIAFNESYREQISPKRIECQDLRYTCYRTRQRKLQ